MSKNKCFGMASIKDQELDAMLLRQLADGRIQLMSTLAEKENHSSSMVCHSDLPQKADAAVTAVLLSLIVKALLFLFLVRGSQETMNKLKVFMTCSQMECTDTGIQGRHQCLK